MISLIDDSGSLDREDYDPEPERVHLRDPIEGNPICDFPEPEKIAFFGTFREDEVTCQECLDAL